MGFEVEKDWITKAGLRAVALMVNDGSHRCGYVAVPQGHPLYEIDYHQETSVINFQPEDIQIGKKSPVLAITATCGGTDGEIRKSPDIAFDVHGGLTFSGKGDKGYPVNSPDWWFGFDCAHAGDATKYSNFSGDIFRSLEFVTEECESLAAQIKEMFPDE